MTSDVHGLTVFIISCGEEVYGECRAALETQTVYRKVDVSIEVIDNVAPMSEAFNEMHRRCRTPYFVQVDADMILYPNALEILYDGISRAPLWYYVAYGQLYEPGFGIGGAIRCWRKSFFRFFDFQDCRTVDRNLFERARRFGLRRKNLAMVLGKHCPRHSLESEYLKSKSDVEKWRFLRRGPQMYAIPALERMLLAPEENKFKLFGFLTGALSSRSRIEKSKDILLEKKRLSGMLDILGYSRLDDLRVCSECLDKQLVELFSRYYRSDGFGDDNELASLIGRIFGNRDSIDAVLFEEEARR